ncbi:MAG: nicotinate (nicotinamide) nucleotide adenylyltransferase [Candidatus Margulisiibacteriota bacterium]
MVPGIGLFGGTFDPVHNGHLAIIQAAAASGRIKHLFVIPSGTPAQKTKLHLDTETRMQLLQLAIRELDLPIPLSVSTFEIDRPVPSFTIDTVQHFKALFPNDQLYLIIGADQWEQFSTWKDPETLQSLAHIWVANRHHTPSLNGINQHPLAIPDWPVSSTEIRSKAQHGKSLKPEVPNSVGCYIALHHLFSAPESKPKTPVVIGITGRVGSGKSAAADYLSKTYDLPIIDLDLIGHEALKNPGIKQKLVAHFGPDILTPQGDIHRPSLGPLVFSNSKALYFLNALVHPWMKTEVLKHLKRGKPSLLVGSLIQEMDLNAVCFGIMVIDADDEAICTRNKDKFLRVSPHQRSRKAFQNSGDVVVENKFTFAFFEALDKALYDMVLAP